VKNNVISSNSANETFSYYESVDSDGNLQPILTPLAYENTTQALCLFGQGCQ
jgi:hypothetical protein